MGGDSRMTGWSLLATRGTHGSSTLPDGFGGPRSAKPIPWYSPGGGRLCRPRGGLGLSALRVVAMTALVVALVACGRVAATRDFNYGVRYFNDHEFDAAVRAFERASEVFEGPAIRYNLALARLAALRAPGPSDKRGQSNRPDPPKTQAERHAEAFAAVAAARSLPTPTDAMLAKLGYIEGSLHVLAGDDKAARSAFARSLAADPGFKPTLKALVKIDPASDSTVARLLLATIEVERLKPEPKPDRIIAR